MPELNFPSATRVKIRHDHVVEATICDGCNGQQCMMNTRDRPAGCEVLVTCEGCGNDVPVGDTIIVPIVSYDAGGTTAYDNALMLCKDCHEKRKPMHRTTNMLTMAARGWAMFELMRRVVHSEKYGWMMREAALENMTTVKLHDGIRLLDFENERAHACVLCDGHTNQDMLNAMNAGT